MHWGIRRFQNADGTLTAAGRKRYSRDMQVRTYNKVASCLNNGEIEKFNNEYGHLATANPAEYEKQYLDLYNRIWNEEAEKTEKAYNTPKKSTRELNRLKDYRYKASQGKEKVETMLSSGSPLADAGLTEGSIVRLDRAGYNYLKANRYIY